MPSARPQAAYSHVHVPHAACCPCPRAGYAPVSMLMMWVGRQRCRPLGNASVVEISLTQQVLLCPEQVATGLLDHLRGASGAIS
jgi:hypothetical protein